MVALGFYDGPTEGFLRCGGCGREFRFRWIDVSEESAGDGEVRIFGLSGLPSNTIARFEEAMSPFDRPKSSLWFPVWSFPTEAARDSMDALVESLYAGVSSEGIVAAFKDGPMGEMICSRFVPVIELADRRDWFEFLGLIRSETLV